MAIQMRRGKYSAFLPSKLQPGEWAVVQSEDDKSADGRSVYMAFAANVVKRMATYDDMVDNCKTAIKESEADIVKSLSDTESSVKAAEAKRVSAEKSRVSAETARETASKTAVSNAEAATTAANAAATKATEAAGGCVTAVTTEYAVTTDSTAAPTSGWSETAPTYKQGEFVWSRNVVTHGDGKSETTDPVVITGNDGKSPTATVTKSGTTATITVNNTDGTKTTATVSDGAKGDKGDAGAGFAWNLLKDSTWLDHVEQQDGFYKEFANSSKGSWDGTGTRVYIPASESATAIGGLVLCEYVDELGLESGTYITESFDFKYVSGNAHVLAYQNTPSNKAWYGTGLSCTYLGFDEAVADPGNWHRMSITIRIPERDKLYADRPMVGMQVRVDGNGSEYWIRNVKVEAGQVATPWCTTQAETIGADGTDGSSVTAVKLQYAISDSSTTAPTSSWQDSVPDWQTGKYIWQRSATTIKAADGTTTTQYGTAVLWQALDNIGATIGDVEESIHFGDGSLGLLSSAPASGGISLGNLALTGANDQSDTEFSMSRLLGILEASTPATATITSVASGMYMVATQNIAGVWLSGNSTGSSWSTGGQVCKLTTPTKFADTGTVLIRGFFHGMQSGIYVAYGTDGHTLTVTTEQAPSVGSGQTVSALIPCTWTV